MAPPKKEDKDKVEKNLRTCIVPFCPTRAVTGLSRLPKDAAKKQKWLEILQIKFETKLTPNSRVCHKHFHENAFTNSKVRKKLKPTAEPTERLHEAKQENLDFVVQNKHDLLKIVGKPIKISEEKIKTEFLEGIEEVPKRENDTLSMKTKFKIFKTKNEVEDNEEMQEVHSSVQPIWIKEEPQEISTSNDHYQDPLTEFNNDIKKENT